jgi:hypothetical protein
MAKATTDGIANRSKEASTREIQMGQTTRSFVRQRVAGTITLASLLPRLCISKRKYQMATNKSILLGVVTRQVVAVAVVLFASVSTADTIFNNFGPGNSVGGTTYFTVYPPAPSYLSQALKFTVPSASDYNLTSILLSLDSAPTALPGAVYIFPDEAGLPGPTSISTLTVPTPSSTFTNELAVPTATLTLDAGHSYWVLPGAASGQGAGGWGWASSPFDTSTPLAILPYNFHAWSLSTPLGGVPAMAVTASPVPEPTTLTLLATALLGLGVASFVRRRRAAA